ncbi:MAG: hypothetical protein ACTSX9_04210 [Candidatus Njordarchaeales archaeon]
MLRAPPKLIYIRWIGALCSTVPLGLLLVLLAFLKALTIETIVWSIAHFSPLILFSYFLDSIYSRIPKISSVRYPIVKIGFGWLVSYPISQAIGDIIYFIALNDFTYLEMYILYPVGMLISVILLGLLYGFFFYAVYMILLRWYLMRKLKPYFERKKGTVIGKRS